MIIEYVIMHKKTKKLFLGYNREIMWGDYDNPDAFRHKTKKPLKHFDLEELDAEIVPMQVTLALVNETQTKKRVIKKKSAISWARKNILGKGKSEHWGRGAWYLFHSKTGDELLAAARRAAAKALAFGDAINVDDDGNVIIITLNNTYDSYRKIYCSSSGQCSIYMATS